MTSFVFRGVYIVTGQLVGYSIDRFGTDAMLWGLGAAILLVVDLFLLPLLSEIELLHSGMGIKDDAGKRYNDNIEAYLYAQSSRNEEAGGATKPNGIGQVPS